MFHTLYYKERRLGKFDTLAEAKDAVKKHFIWNTGLEGKVADADIEFPEAREFDKWMWEFDYVIKSRRKTSKEKWAAYKKGELC